MAEKPKHYAFHDAKTGKFVTAGHAYANPDTTVRIEQRANLGMATTKQLIDELAARAHIANIVQEPWVTYTTLDGD